jgi:hypothetical protein
MSRKSKEEVEKGRRNGKMRIGRRKMKKGIYLYRHISISNATYYLVLLLYHKRDREGE